jgi:hypothetical protein
MQAVQQATAPLCSVMQKLIAAPSLRFRSAHDHAAPEMRPRCGPLPHPPPPDAPFVVLAPGL